MIYHGKTVRLANLATQHGGNISNETSSTLNIDCDILKGASSTMPHGKTQHAGLKSWSVSGDVFFNQTQFIVFWHWLAQGEAADISFYTPDFSIHGDAILTSITITASIRNSVHIQFKAVGTGKPEITYFE